MIAAKSLDVLAGRTQSLTSEATLLLERVREFLRSKSAGCDEPFTLRAQIIPLDPHGMPGEPSEIELRDFSERGLAFTHDAPITDRRARLSVDDPRFGKLNAEVDLSWCRYQPGGRYTSGGRFVR
ncbi:hypothetical protein [Adhaeretor mobilis]|nr:hypothetical protein [Adhaeretor mobilis]